MSIRLSGTLLPILALMALAAGCVPAHASDNDLYGQGQYTAFGAQADAQTRKVPAIRIYVPLHPAEPREVSQEFAPAQTTAFGGIPSRRAPPHPVASSAAGGKPPAVPDPSARIGKNNGATIQCVELPKGG